MRAFVGASIGVVLAAEPDCRYTDLLRKADVALYKAKSEGRGCFRVFSEEMDERRSDARLHRSGAARGARRRTAAWRSTTSRSMPMPTRR